jgi:hypothetical protein
VARETLGRVHVHALGVLRVLERLGGQAVGSGQPDEDRHDGDEDGSPDEQRGGVLPAEEDPGQRGDLDREVGAGEHEGERGGERGALGPEAPRGGQGGERAGRGREAQHGRQPELARRPVAEVLRGLLAGDEHLDRCRDGVPQG